MSYNGWMIVDNSRENILSRFKPKYQNVKCSHITNELDTIEFPIDSVVSIVGYVDSTDGIEVLICEVNGELYRPDGNIFHVTLSHNSDYSPKDSNKIITNRGWEEIPVIYIETKSFFSKGGSYYTSALTK